MSKASRKRRKARREVRYAYPGKPPGFHFEVEHTKTRRAPEVRGPMAGAFYGSVFLLTFVVLAGIFAVTKACAQPAPDEAVQLRYQGAEGIWFPAPFARELLDLYSRAPLMEERIATLRLAGQQATEEVRTLRLALDAGEAAEQDLGRQLRDSQRAREELESWYREPGLWLGLGVAAGALVVGVLWALVGL